MHWSYIFFALTLQYIPSMVIQVSFWLKSRKLKLKIVTNDKEIIIINWLVSGWSRYNLKNVIFYYFTDWYLQIFNKK